MTARQAWLIAVATAAIASTALPLHAVPPATDEFVVGIGRSIHDSAGVSAAFDWLGVRSMRVDAPWSSVETAPGRYAIPAWLDEAVDSARAHDVEPLLILAYGHPLYGGDKPRSTVAIEAFARYARYVTEHFEGRVQLFDLWNEWDAHTGRTTEGSAGDYVALARRAYPAIKAANPDAVVLSGGISSLGLSQGFVERFIELGGLEFVDGLSLHPYNFERRDASGPEGAIAELDRVHALTRAAGKPLPIYVTEMGYPAFSGRGGVTADDAALLLARFLLLASTRPYVAGVWWYCLRDQGSDPNNKEHNFGVFDVAMKPKPAGRALRAVAQLLRDVGRFRDDGAGGEQHISGAHPDGTAVAFAWRPEGTSTDLLRDLLALTAPAPPGAAKRAIEVRP